ncbi:MAG: purine-nucleoside phosphorylase [bacterium]
MDKLQDMIRETENWIRSKSALSPSIGLVLGSGLGEVELPLEDILGIPYQEIPHFPRSTAPGHMGVLLLGRLGKVFVAVLKGRFHYYEGYSTSQITFPLRILKTLGIKTLILTNAAGGLNPQFKPGDIMGIVDHINFIPDNPLRGLQGEILGERFPDMSRAYDPQLLDLAEEVALAQGFVLRRGVYVAVPGPSLETPAETRFLRMAGADAVGMSTTAEVIVARSIGLKVIGISVISNVNRPDCMAPISVKEILQCSLETAPRLAGLLKGILERLSEMES